ncbi:MAG: dihydrolipoyl dehydrogenase [Dehalococcoidales bacterium]|nr:MAG: dihydrolipoyl dehydrogenase [Dehalococcoidales bacterium]
MKDYDVIVIGSGSGAIIANEAASNGLMAALIDQGPMIGGTCPNWGCIPSKQLIYTADRLVDIREAEKLGIQTTIENIHFSEIMERMRTSRQRTQEELRQGLQGNDHLDFYEGRAKFIDDYIIEVNDQELKGNKICIASGARPFVPPIPGLDKVDYLTNESVLELKEKPENLIVIGGGYIAVEFGHFLAAVGTDITMVEMADRLVLAEEPEMAEILRNALSQRMKVYTGHSAEEVHQTDSSVSVITKDKNNGETREFTADNILVAVGRKSNADTLQLEKTGVEIDARGFIKTNEYLETTRPNIYAVGDANGQGMFRHMANREAILVANNVFYNAGVKIDYTYLPHAVYSYPQIASVGLTESQAKERYDISVATTRYFDTAKGEAMLEMEGFAKVITEKDTGKMLGFHIIGPYAPELIQEVVNAMTSGGGSNEIRHAIHIHPSLSELVQDMIANLE